MTIVLAVVVGTLYAAGLYMMLRRSLVKLIIGFILLSHAANLLIFTVSGLTRGQPPLLPAKGGAIPAAVADPLPQALVLTAIVISFGVLAFALALFHRTYAAVGTDDLDQIKATDQ
ncbi:MAG: Na+/H+ antiporter subunit C [Acidobacteriota bacterium]